MNISYSPSKENFEAIFYWLDKEYESTGEGFWINKTAIENAFYKERLICLSEGKSVIAFAVWLMVDAGAHIEILEVHPNWRNQGYGTLFVDEILNMFKQRGIERVYLECSPTTSLKFWKKFGFNENFRTERRYRAINKIPMQMCIAERYLKDQK